MLKMVIESEPIGMLIASIRWKTGGFPSVAVTTNWLKVKGNTLNCMRYSQVGNCTVLGFRGHRQIASAGTPTTAGGTGNTHEWHRFVPMEEGSVRDTQNRFYQSPIQRARQ